MAIGVTPIREGTGPARLLDMVEGRSKQAFMSWLAERPTAWRDAVEVVAVMDPFHVALLAGKALDEFRRRVQQAIHGHRGRTGL